ncbi:MAG: hypothetical protein LBP35_05965 [Candidatus Ancillula trichonymphae]|jgi:O-antigen/teichoic acid export membrane protein|nr:hypothetical protein [Candidatus Ancillula trichonymphae]
MPNLKQILIQITKFATSALANTLITLLSIPILISKLGAALWGELALIQSISTFFAIFVAYGWGTIGSGLVASIKAESRREFYGRSVIIRIWLYAIAVVVQALFLCIISQISLRVILLGALSYLLPNLGAWWFYIGESSPRHLLFYDMLPKALGTLFGLVFVWFFRTPESLLLPQLVFNLILPVAALKIIRPTSMWISPREQFSALKTMLSGFLAASMAALYVNLPLVLVQILLPEQLAYYALADKFFKYATQAFSPVTQTLQGWIPEKTELLMSRAKLGVMISAAIGMCGWIFLALALSPLTALLSARTIEVSHELGFIFGGAFCMIAISQIIGVAILVPLKRETALVTSTTLGVLVALPLMLIFALKVGVGGVALALTISEFCVTGFQMLAFFKIASTSK